VAMHACRVAAGLSRHRIGSLQWHAAPPDTIRVLNTHTHTHRGNLSGTQA
jgi:hypothetical protein